MITLLLTVLVLFAIFGLVAYAINMLPLPPPFPTVANVVLAIILILILASWLFPYAEHPPLALR